jgi:hypothetical protein
MQPSHDSLDWRVRLIDRMIKNNPDATIADYLNIVDDNYKKPETEVKVVQVLPRPHVSEKKAPKVSTDRPAAVYSNRGHEQIINEYAK